MVSSKEIKGRRKAADALGSVFALLPDKLQGWQDLVRLTQDQDSDVRKAAARALGSAFVLLSDKDQAWQELHQMAHDQHNNVRWGVARAMGSVFALLPDKKQGEEDLHRFTLDQKSVVRQGAARALGSAFALLSDKTRGGQDLHKLTQDRHKNVRESAALALGSSFVLLLDKDQAWQDLHKLTQDQHSGVRRDAARSLGSSFALLPDKDQGWQDLHRLANDQNSDVRWGVARAMGSVFALLPDKKQGEEDLHRFTLDQKSVVRQGAARALGSAFALLSDKTRGGQDLHKLTQDRHKNVRESAALALGSSFVLLLDKDQAWQDLHKLTQDQHSNVRRAAARSLGSSFAHLPDKDQGWQDLLRLAQDHDSGARSDASHALGSSFALLPDKTQGWQVFHRLTQDKKSRVRSTAANSLGSSFALLLNKDQAWQDLHRLTQDQSRDVRMYAYHSLGRASVYRALEANEKTTIRSELEAAVEFFEKSYQEQPYYNPASFCRPFYRSYLALTFQEASGVEVKKYLAEAKKAVGSSENRKELFGAVENLAKALEETQKLKDKSKENIQSDLQAFQWYCDRAAEHMASVDEKAPGAVGLLRKCNPIIEERIEATIAGIQKTAREICQMTRGSGTKYEAPSAEINREAKCLSLEDPFKTFKTCTSIASSLKEFCRNLPQDKRGRGCEIVDEIEAEHELSGKLLMIDRALIYLQPNIDLAVHESSTKNKLDEIHSDIRTMDRKLNTIIFDLSNIKIGSGNIFANLCAVRSELNKIAEVQKISLLNQESISINAAHRSESQVGIAKLIESKVSELEEILKTKSNREDNQAILNELEDLKPSTEFEWLGRIADVIAVFDASIKVFALLM
jgi:HEAT repeat protein